MREWWDNFRERWAARRERFALAFAWYAGHCGYVVRSTLATVMSWWHTRAFRLLLGGLPALIALVGLPVFAIFVPSEVELSQRYARTADACKQKEDYAGAILRYERLTQLTPAHPGAQFDFATTLEEAGKHERASKLIEPLANADERGYAPAHIWQARRLLKRSGVSREDQRTAERHLRFALERTSELPDAQALLGELCFAQQRYQEADVYLKSAVNYYPELFLSAAKTNAMLGRPQVVRLYAEQAQRYYEKVIREDPANVSARLACAESSLLLEEFAKAADVLQPGLAGLVRKSDNVAKEQAALHTALSRAYFLWSEKAARTEVGERLRLLELSLKHNPANLEAVMSLWSMMRLKGDLADRARAALRNELTRGQANALVHVALGMDAWDRSENKEALVHLEQAYRLAPQMLMVANNLAWVLAQSQPPDLERALKLINSVIDQAPDNPVCRDTRGLILANMGRWREALPDLQEALKGYPDRAELHVTLAEAYRNLGVPAMAAEHTRMAEDLRKKAGTHSRR